MGKKQITYEELALMPSAIARSVAENQYEGLEFSEKSRIPSEIAEIEHLRLDMTPKDRMDFAVICNDRCRIAYERKAKWFMSCVKSGDQGRDQLAVRLTHWLCAFLKEYDQAIAQLKLEGKTVHPETKGTV